MMTSEMKIVNRWNSVMNYVGCEHITIDTRLSELADHKEYYSIEDGITIGWMLKEARYWLSCYYEEGNVRCDDKHYDADSYKAWLSETGKLKRLIARLEKMDENEVVVKW